MAITLDAAYYQRLQDLQAVDFALVELTLYLDTHPLDPYALRQFNRLSQERQELARRFEELYGPLLQFGRSFSREPWEWSQPPWPWQV
ncbi:spore coat protein CotJB [Gorillibacterium massiliense]|uniref:spore coat protein CotJB n=1 Tax=Gorillibacterium massiliense TaxID=1280390 RepID=UPI0004BA7492|nr:spore coat protein CotJB [Gorillibacterium massiliense]